MDYFSQSGRDFRFLSEAEWLALRVVMACPERSRRGLRLGSANVPRNIS